MGWLAFAGWIIIPFLVGRVANQCRERRQGYIGDAGLLLIGGTFVAGSIGLVRRFLRSSCTWGSWTAGSFHILGVLSLAVLVVLGIRTKVTDDSRGKEIFTFNEKRSWLWHEIWNRYGYKDRTGKIVIPARFDYAFDFHEGLAVVVWKGHWGAIDSRGDWAIRPEYDDAYGCFSEGLLAVCQDGRWGFIDNKGRLVIPHRFEYARMFTEGRAAVKVNGKWGFTDVSGKLVVEPRFGEVGTFVDGLAPVNIGGKVRSDGWSRRIADGRWGYVTSSGEMAIEPRFLQAYCFNNGRADVVDENGPGTIDRTGRIIERPRAAEEEEPAE